MSTALFFIPQGLLNVFFLSTFRDGPLLGMVTDMRVDNVKVFFKSVDLYQG